MHQPSKEPFPSCPRCSAGNRFVMQRTDDPDKYACRNCDHRFTDIPKPVTIPCLPDTVRLFQAKDDVNAAEHYGGPDNPYEVGKVLHAWKLHEYAYLWNVVKYVARRNDKGQPIKDLKKARFYLDCEIARLEGRNHWTERTEGT